MFVRESVCVYYLSVWEVVVPDVKSSLSFQCSYQNRMEVYLRDKNSLGLGLQYNSVNMNGKWLHLHSAFIQSVL